MKTEQFKRVRFVSHWFDRPSYLGQRDMWPADYRFVFDQFHAHLDRLTVGERGKPENRIYYPRFILFVQNTPVMTVIAQRDPNWAWKNVVLPKLNELVGA